MEQPVEDYKVRGVLLLHESVSVSASRPPLGSSLIGLWRSCWLLAAVSTGS